MVNVKEEKIAKDFQALWLKEHGEEIDLETAKEYAQRLVEFFDLLIEIEHKSKSTKKNAHASTVDVRVI